LNESQQRSKRANLLTLMQGAEWAAEWAAVATNDPSSRVQLEGRHATRQREAQLLTAGQSVQAFRPQSLAAISLHVPCGRGVRDAQVWPSPLTVRSHSSRPCIVCLHTRHTTTRHAYTRALSLAPSLASSQSLINLTLSLTHTHTERCASLVLCALSDTPFVLASLQI
jgi:hypothetical protein